jgi:hypothetical protein
MFEAMEPSCSVVDLNSGWSILPIIRSPMDTAESVH